LSRLMIVIPTYNEAENLPVLTAKLFGLPIEDLELLIVDDNSPDGTGRLAEELSKQYGGRIRVLHRAGKLGLGSAYILGFQHALKSGAQAVAQMDADFSHNPQKIPALLKMLDEYDVAVGSRYVEGGSLDERWSLWRVLLSRFGNTYARSILRLPLLDTTGGFRVWRREVLQHMPLERVRSNGYVFQVEMAYVAAKLGYRFIESPIYFEDRRIGQSKMSFGIQIEAAVRVWQLPWLYRDL